MKMKRSKSDMVKTALGSYLKRRHYTESDVFRKSDLQLTQTHEQMAVLAVIDKESTKANTFIFSSTSYDMVQVDNQFSRFKTWVTELNGESMVELLPLICPIFCHLYFELVLSNPRPMATRFLKRHLSTVLIAQGRTVRLIEEISSVTSLPDMLMSPVVQEFRSGKYHAKLSPNVLILLQKYLAKQGHMLLLQILDIWFDFELDVSVPKLADGSDSEETVMDLPVSQEIDADDKELIHIREAIRLVNGDRALPTKLHVHSILNNDNNVNCAYRLENTIAVGWDSEVRLFGSDIVPGPNPASFVSVTDDDITSQRVEMAPDSWVTLRGHSRQVQGVGTAGDMILTVSRDKTMRAWTQNAACVAIYRGHNYPIWCLDVGPLDATVATGSRDKTACLWTLDRVYPIRILAGHHQDIECVQFHPNGQYVATGSTDRSVRMWSLTDANMVRVFGDHRGAVQSLAFSPNGQYLATGGEDKRVRVWDIAESAVLMEFKGHTGTVQGLAWSSDSDQLASCSADGTVRLWDTRNTVTNSAPTPSTVYNTDCSSILNVYFSRSNSLVAIGVDE